MEYAALFSKWLLVTIATAAAFLNGLCSGMHLGWTSPSLIKLQAENSPVPITSDQGSWIVVVFFFGIMIGCVLWNAMSQKITKRLVLMVASGPFVISWLFIAFARSYYLLIVARLLAGISEALVICSAPLFLGEVSSSAVRGLVISFVPLSSSAGYLLVNVLGSYADIKTTALISLIFPLLSLCLFVLVPDSPYDLIQRHQLEAAKNSLKKFRGVEDVEEDFKRIKDAIEEQIATSAGSCLDLIVVPNYRKSLITLLGVRTIYQLSGYTTVNVYAQSIFLMIDGADFAVIFSSIYFVVPMVFTVLSLFLVDGVGRKPLLLSATVATFGILVIITTVCYLNDANRINRGAYVFIVTGALLAYTAVFSFGVHCAPTILQGEIFTSPLKSLGSCIHELYYCFLTIIVTKLFQITSDKFGMQVPFLIFAICTFFGIFFIMYYVPETKRKNLEEIQCLLKNEDEIISLYMEQGTLK